MPASTTTSSALAMRLAGSQKTSRMRRSELGAAVVLVTLWSCCATPRSWVPQPKRFSNFANWLLPQKLLVGRYPFSCPVYCESRARGDKQMQRLMRDAGVTFFVCLQGELPPQEDPEAWPERGVRVHGYSHPFAPYAEEARALAPHRPLTFLHAPLQDLGVPSGAGPLERLLDALERHLCDDSESAGPAYLHCWGGRGRTGLVAACLLGRLCPELTADESLRLVQAGYSSRRDPLDVGALARSPQTHEQREFVKRWYSRRHQRSGPY